MNVEFKNFEEILKGGFPKGQLISIREVMEGNLKGIKKEQIQAEVKKFEKRLNDINSVKGEQII